MQTYIGLTYEKLPAKETLVAYTIYIYTFVQHKPTKCTFSELKY